MLVVGRTLTRGEPGPGLGSPLVRQYLVHLPLRPQGGMELSHGLDDPQPGPHRPLGVIFVRQGGAEVDQEPIAEVLGDMPLEAGDHLGARGLISPHHLAQRFRVELARQAQASSPHPI